jgi:single-strand DNA-binding protein
MASSLNKVILIGNVGRDPEVRTTQDGKEIASFSIATSESWKDKMTGDRKEKTEWHRIVIFSQPLVNIVKNYIKKGSKLYVEGSLHTRKWNDQSGAEKTTTEVVLQSYHGTLVMLDNRHGTASAGSGSYGQDNHAPAREPTHIDDNRPEYSTEHLDDEIPF